MPDLSHVYETLFLSTADMHAQFWRDESLLKNTWMKGMRQVLGYDRHQMELYFSVIKLKWNRLKKAMQDGTAQVKWTENLVQVMDRVIENTSWESFQASFNVRDIRTPFTLCHGDYHLQNIWWATTSTPKVHLVDWAEVGPVCPFTDLGEYSCLSMSRKFRSVNEKRLFGMYHNRLIEKGISSDLFPIERCWKMYEVGGIERGLYILVFVGVLVMDRPGALPETHHLVVYERVRDFVLDHFDYKHVPSLSTMYFHPI